MASAIQTVNLTKKYPAPYAAKNLFSAGRLRESFTALDSVSISVDKGRLFGLIGPNGAGKTTLIKTLCTTISPTSGSAFVNGFEIRKDGAKIRGCIGLISGDQRSFYWRLTGKQNLEFFASLLNLTRETAKKRISTLLEELDLTAQADKMFQTYSAGMKQKIAIARGLLSEPAILFLDEPTNSLDPISAGYLKKFIKDNIVGERGVTVLFTTHRLDEIEQLCNQIAVLDQGKVIFSGSVDEFKKTMHLSSYYVLEVNNIKYERLLNLNNIPEIKEIQIQSRPFDTFSIEFILAHSDSALPSVIDQLVADGGKILSCKQEESSLEDIYLKLMQENGQ